MKLSLLKIIFYFFILICETNCNIEIKNYNAIQIEETLINQKNNEINQVILEMTNFIKIDINLNKLNFLPYKNYHKDSKICKSCLLIYNKIQNILLKKYGMKGILELMTRLCQLGLDYKICNEMVNLYFPIFYDSILDHYINGEFICTITKACKNSHYKVLNADEYARDILKDKPVKLNLKNEIDLNAPTWKVLHVSDIHVDFLYKEGSKGKCSDPLCCRENTKDRNKIYNLYDEDKAGKWGHVGYCDLPEKTIDNFADFVFNQIKPDFIIWTGDNPAHDPWVGSQESAFKATQFLTDLILNKYNYTLPVYPSVGNHEVYPNDEFYPYDKREQFLFEKLSEIFKFWLSEEAYQTFSKFGYYSKLHPNSNLRIISTNCLLCDSLNFNLIKNPTDPQDEIKWLEKTLRQSEIDGEVVYLIRHIPVGDGFFLDQCAKRFQAIIDRFSHIIKGQFYGHTHKDEIKIAHNYFDYNKLSGVMFIAPSLTTYDFLNPSFRLFEVDSHSKIPIDYLQYRLNITKANLDTPRWEISYRATEHFNVKWLNQTNGLYNFTLNIKNDHQLFDKTLKAFYSDGPKYNEYLTHKRMPLYLSCRFKETIFKDFLKCLNNKTLFYNEYAFSVLNYLNGNWFEKLSDK